MFLLFSCGGLRSSHWTEVLSWEWRCSWSSADRRYIFCINNFIAYQGATYIRGFTVTLIYCKLDPRNTPQSNSNRNSNIFIEEDAFENVSCKMDANASQVSMCYLVEYLINLPIDQYLEQLLIQDVQKGCGRVGNSLEMGDLRRLATSLYSTVETLYNTIDFCWSTHKRHSIARLKGRGMGCLLWVQRATFCVDLSILSSIKYLS